MRNTLAACNTNDYLKKILGKVTQKARKSRRIFSLGRYAQNLKKIFEKNLRKGHTKAMRFAKEKSIKKKVFGLFYELKILRKSLRKILGKVTRKARKTRRFFSLGRYAQKLKKIFEENLRNGEHLADGSFHRQG